MSVFFASYALAAASARIGIGSAIDRMGRQRVAVTCLILYIAVVAGMAELDSIGLAPLGAVFGVAHGLFFPACNAMAIERMAPSERGRGMTLVIGAFNLGFALGPLGLGFVAKAAGYPTAFACAAGLAGIALVLLATLRDPKPT